MRRYFPISRYLRRRAGQERYRDLCEAAKKDFDAYISNIHLARQLARQHPVLLPALQRHLETFFPGVGLSQLIGGGYVDEE